MTHSLTRRQFLGRAAAASAAAACLRLPAWAQDKPARPPASPHTLTVIAGKPRERGRQYGQKFQGPIRAFLDREIYKPFVGAKQSRDDLLRYAAACDKEIKSYSPLIHDELEGMAEGSGLRREELVLITLHEELWHRGPLPPIEHCTTVAVGPEAGAAGDTFVGQTWDWMASVYGLSDMLLWKRPEGPSLLAYAYPGLWVGAGLNSAGIALVWTSAGKGGPRVGIPSYVLLTQMLYQDSLKAALAEARRARQAGYFTFVLGDGEGQLANVEGSPKELAVELGRGRMVRHNYGSRQLTGTAEGKTAPVNGRCQRVHEVIDRLASRRGKETLEGVFADKEVGGGALDVMIFNTTKREAYLTRGPGDAGRWKRFDFSNS
jgi:isopenicillin-N N-acyltransferase-like protein